eukprot:Hpha_TRINITY_DN16087_c4_g8::TRINITY_DN16087_c4_g8_i1::g.118642::m.118642
MPPVLFCMSCGGEPMGGVVTSCDHILCGACAQRARAAACPVEDGGCPLPVSTTAFADSPELTKRYRQVTRMPDKALLISTGPAIRQLRVARVLHERAREMCAVALRRYRQSAACENEASQEVAALKLQLTRVKEHTAVYRHAIARTSTAVPPQPSQRQQLKRKSSLLQSAVKKPQRSRSRFGGSVTSSQASSKRGSRQPSLSSQRQSSSQMSSQRQPSVSSQRSTSSSVFDGLF